VPEVYARKYRPAAGPCHIPVAVAVVLIDPVVLTAVASWRVSTHRIRSLLLFDVSNRSVALNVPSTCTLTQRPLTSVDGMTMALRAEPGVAATTCGVVLLMLLFGEYVIYLLEHPPVRAVAPKGHGLVLIGKLQARLAMTVPLAGVRSRDWWSYRF
jgi:hypothetical protein